MIVAKPVLRPHRAVRQRAGCASRLEHRVISRTDAARPEFNRPRGPQDVNRSPRDRMIRSICLVSHRPAIARCLYIQRDIDVDNPTYGVTDALMVSILKGRNLPLRDNHG